MGTWGWCAWDNDPAADWFGDLFHQVPLRRAVVAKLSEAVTEDNAEEVPAALLVLLGRTYVWPVEHLDADLGQAIGKLTALLDLFPYSESEESRAAVTAEIDLLQARLRGSDKPANFAAIRWWSELAT